LQLKHLTPLKQVSGKNN